MLFLVLKFNWKCCTELYNSFSTLFASCFCLVWSPDIQIATKSLTMEIVEICLGIFRAVKLLHKTQNQLKSRNQKFFLSIMSEKKDQLNQKKIYKKFPTFVFWIFGAFRRKLFQRPDNGGNSRAKSICLNYFLKAFPFSILITKYALRRYTIYGFYWTAVLYPCHI